MPNATLCGEVGTSGARRTAPVAVSRLWHSDAVALVSIAGSGADPSSAPMLKRTRRLPRLLTARSVPPGERAALAAGLRAAGPPAQGLAAPRPAFFALLPPRGTLAGYGGLEVLGADALLRSVITVPEMRDRAYGVAIVSRMELLALRRGARTLYLLTTTAASFFEKLGYAAIDRSEAPPAVAATREFTIHCPASAVL